MSLKPEELRYNETHEWLGIVEENGEQLGVVGITDFAVQQLTDLVYMALPEVGAEVRYGEEFGEVESVKAVSPLYCPVDGEVVAVHSDLVDRLEVLGDDPFGEGWIMKVKLSAGADPGKLLDYEAYRKQCAQA